MQPRNFGAKERQESKILLLTSISDVLRLTTSLAVSTIEVHTSWIDKIGTTDSTPDRQNTSITTATTTTIVPSPAVGVQRNVRLITVTNDSSTACTVDVQHFSGTAVTLRKFLVQAGDTLQYTTAKGFEILINTAVKTFVPPVSVITTPVVKASILTQLAGSYASLWRGIGYPAQGAIPTAAAACSEATVGAMPLAARTGAQKRLVTGLELSNSTTGTTVILVDRLVHMGGLSGIVATAQTINADASLVTFDLPNRIGAPDYSSIEWYMEWYTATGATGVTPSFSVTHGDNTTGLASIFNAGSPVLPASVAASRMYQILATSGKPIKSIQSVTMPTTATAGNFGVTAYRRLRTSLAAIGNAVTSDKGQITDALSMSDSTCLNLITLCVATNTGAVQGATVQTVVA